jgi:protein-tyrosine phosphatase
VTARPRGGDWLAGELSGWRRAGIDSVLSLLTPGEEADLDLRNEAVTTKAHGMKFLSFPIRDREVPNSESELAAMLEKVDADLTSGKNVLIHCRHGIGRSGLVAACLLVTKGLSPEEAVNK